ncbi:MAG TPA: DUF3105 domain-containing protein [Candidatus Limnocylindrales bacterium]
MPKPPRRSTSRPVPGRAAAPQAGAAAGSRPGRARRVGRQSYQASFLERNRTRLLWAGAVVVVVALGALFYLQSTAPAYACGVEWTAPATASPAPGSSPRLGFPQEDMGRDHVAVGTTVKYLYCPPASGNHYQSPAGPIAPRLYGPNDRAVPEGWVHNLEHGALVLVYKCPGDGCTDAGQAALQQFYASFPASPICNIPPHQLSPVIARFDDMAYPYAALIWDQVLPLQTLDTQQILAFFAQQAERTNPEPQCAAPTAVPSAAPSASPAASDAGSPAAPASDVPSPGAAPSAG